MESKNNMEKLIDINDIILPESSTMPNNNTKDYAANQGVPTRKDDADVLEKYSKRSELPIQNLNTIPNSTIVKEKTMVLVHTEPTNVRELKDVKKIETVDTHNEVEISETEKNKIKKNCYIVYTTFFKTSVPSKFSEAMESNNKKEGGIKTDTINQINTFNYSNSILNNESGKRFVIEKTNTPKFEASLWEYIRKPLNPEKSKKTHVRISQKNNEPFNLMESLEEQDEYERHTPKLPVGSNCDNLDSLKTVFYHIPEDEQRQDMEYYFCSSCNRPSNNLPGNECQECRKRFHWKCVAHTKTPNYGISWYCNQCLLKRANSNAEVPYLRLFNDSLHHSHDNE